MKKTNLTLLLASLAVGFSKSQKLNVYPLVDGLEQSPFYKVQVKQANDDIWLSPFNFVTECTGEKFCNTTGFIDQLKDWSNSYINFEMEAGTEVDIKITKLFGDPITKAVVRPEAVGDAIIENGEVMIRVMNPTLFTVDINGQMDDQDTGMLPNKKDYYDGPPIHTVTVFANPFISKPSLDDPGVHQVKPGEDPPSEGSWHTLYFLPGVHDVGIEFRVHANRSYYIPGDAIVYGTFTTHEDWWDGSNIHIYGHGTISGDKIPHPNYSSYPDEEYWKFRPITIQNAMNTKIEGITIANSAFHSIILSGPYNPDKPTDIRWVKIFTWRANGDGINAMANGGIEDCFIRTQDDSLYVNGRGIRRVVLWQDSNGSSFVLSSIGQEEMNNHPLIVEDCTVVYSRAYWHHWSGGNLFNMRGEGKGSGGFTIEFRNIVVEDPRPTLQHFKILMEGLKPWSDPEERRRGPGDLWGILFKDVRIAAPSVMDEPEILWGMSDGLIYDLIFENVTIGNVTIDNVDQFLHNEYVFGIGFK